MFSFIVGGPLDPVGGTVALAVLFIVIGVFITSWLVKRRSRTEIANDFQLSVMKLDAEIASAEKNAQRNHEVSLLKIDANKQIELKRIEDKQLITSHKDKEAGEFLND